MEIEEIYEIERLLEKKQKNLDQINDISKKIIRASGIMITKLHNNLDVKEDMDKINGLVEMLKDSDKDYKYYTIQAYQEYSEAMIFNNIKNEGELPSYKELAVPPEAYLLGILDVVGELRREIGDLLNKSDMEKAENYYEIIKSIFDSTRGIRYPDSILPSFRRKQDVARIQMENASSEILISKKKFGN